tara:strand:+ start:53 stop:586 length:534 start_codon:yes stop_codon:yes gene_type:complete
MRKSRNPKAYCRVAFNALNSNIDCWGDPDFFRPITRIFYEQVFSSGYNRTGLISEDAKDNSKQRTHDHCLSPQFICRMIMDNSDIYLSDYDIFESLFHLARTTICVTKDENTQLSLLTENDGINYRVYVPTNLKYQHLGIKLYKKFGASWKNAVKYDENVGDLVPQDLLKYEKKFLV